MISKEYLGIKLATKLVVDIIRKRKLDRATKKLESEHPEYKIYSKYIESMSKVAGAKIVGAIRNKDAKQLTNTLDTYTKKIKDFMKRGVGDLNILQPVLGL